MAPGLRLSRRTDALSTRSSSQTASKRNSLQTLANSWHQKNGTPGPVSLTDEATFSTANPAQASLRRSTRSPVNSGSKSTTCSSAVRAWMTILLDDSSRTRRAGASCFSRTSIVRLPLATMMRTKNRRSTCLETRFRLHTCP